MLERELAKTALDLNLATAEFQSRDRRRSPNASTAQEKVLAACYATEGELTEARQQLAELKLEAERTRGRLESQAGRWRRSFRRLAAGEQEIEALAREQAERSAGTGSPLRRIGRTGAQIAHWRERTGGKGRRAAERASNLTRARAGTRDRAAECAAAAGRIFGLKNRWRRSKRNLPASIAIRRARGTKSSSRRPISRASSKAEGSFPRNLSRGRWSWSRRRSSAGQSKSELQQKKASVNENAQCARPADAAKLRD